MNHVGLRPGSPAAFDDSRYRHHFWRSVRESIYLRLHDPLTFDLVGHYRFPASAHNPALSRDEYDALLTAMRAAHASFLENRRPESLLSAGDHDLRAVLERSRTRYDRMYTMNTRQVARALYEAVRDGGVIFAPDRNELRACVDAIREGSRKRPRDAARPPASARAPYDPVRRMAQNVAAIPVTTSGSTPPGNVRPFSYPPEASNDRIRNLAALTPTQKEACFAQWERDEADCRLFARMMGGVRGVDMCIVQARLNYNLCMGYTRPI
ncbi:hypothetical protein [Paraburkholderia caballeronis]|uniref:hypothetical protein n=1 Tax=Paraburkholderia caballeronis TaxID=416943 RepID=UPI001065FB24|nr:hypothetical protein [Paraburkholderia caballeronis]TDV09222.1 hypothetical protein C7408_11643 [Paraburkholderia caballeronis]TDV12282.1 hypothetical protein C7406_11743 [Paraburkholderia caballeronis]TDV22755.1 hypothetical protein C7404_11643 [Paraburkholderia caballeronis]